MEWLLSLTAFTAGEFLALLAITFVAGLVRGFSGFALSALVMASAATFIAPIVLIPILWFLEMSASLLMARAGIRDADRRIALLLVIGSTIGWPLGLMLTMSLPVETSRIVALALIVALAVLQLLKVQFPGLRTPGGTVVAGIVAGIAAGLAHVGGMVIALYVLSLGTAAASMRGTLVLYLFASGVFSLFIQLGFGTMDGTAALRGLALIPPTLLGVWLGTKFFTPRLQPYYKPFCLFLLIGLALLGLIRTLAA
ncbi:sulfite exporter TauE/SafE family protein [Pseudooctadecabacter jejudonensis]|uniref:Probable membrane transporter protein n=1 Tax=Pseudooctadecabacter jejudonensis TaxID=1391910 RepID=A0A1Y5T6V5_9RHOB|nr:sulfite exporter TauE/SafE family protein [Pseudooctadecabacter jejudonensis]SLN55293.1 Sulfite exporter TauE/SafE [Pseudooctadecabacter jejudonensis]